MRVFHGNGDARGGGRWGGFQRGKGSGQADVGEGKGGVGGVVVFTCCTLYKKKFEIIVCTSPLPTDHSSDARICQLLQLLHEILRIHQNKTRQGVCLDV